MCCHRKCREEVSSPVRISGVATVFEAAYSLMPQPVRNAINAGKRVQRSGEFFLVPSEPSKEELEFVSERAQRVRPAAPNQQPALRQRNGIVRSRRQRLAAHVGREAALELLDVRSDYSGISRVLVVRRK